MGDKLFSIMEDRVSRITTPIESNAMGVFSTLEQVVGNLSFTLVSVLETNNNISNQEPSLFGLYQYRNTGSEEMQLKSSIHSPWQFIRCSMLTSKSGKFASKNF